MKNQLNKLKLIFISMVSMLLFIGAPGLAQSPEDTMYIKTTEKGTRYYLVDWETNVVYNPYTFTWFAWEQPVVHTTTTEVTRMIPVSEFDRPPMFDATCITAKDKIACSNEQLQTYVEDQANLYPQLAEFLKQEGLEYVTFTLNANGDFEGDLRVVSKAQEPCAGCSDAAADIVAGMEDMWYPAIKDGKPVKTELTIPIRFKLIER